jgi:folate-binding protein YgfZ
MKLDGEAFREHIEETMIDVARELNAAREGALLLAAPELGTLEVTGKDRLSWLNGLITSDVGKLRPGEGSYGLSVAKNGKIQCELRLVAAEDRVLVGVRRDRIDAGPVDVTGLGGAAITAPVGAYAAVLAALQAEGDGVVMGTCEGWERLRIERGIPQWGVDFGDDVYPQEASLEKIAVSFNKGCYLGQETVCMLELRGHVKRKLMKIVIQSNEREVSIGAAITLPDGTAVGDVTSRGPSDASDESLALGYVKYKYAVAGTELRIAGHPARIA